jgi:hypothetical protein
MEMSLGFYGYFMEFDVISSLFQSSVDD